MNETRQWLLGMVILCGLLILLLLVYLKGIMGNKEHVLCGKYIKSGPSGQINVERSLSDVINGGIYKTQRVK